MDQRTDGPTDQLMDRPSHRDAWTHLIREKEEKKGEKEKEKKKEKEKIEKEMLIIGALLKVLGPHGAGNSRISTSFQWKTLMYI